MEWKVSEQHKPLILNGVRQCGKTYILKEFGKKEFQNMAYINCDHNEELQAVFSGGFDVIQIIRGISALTGVDVIPGKTFIFLDEVQALPEALESLKYFCENAPEYHIAVAGSLLGLTLHPGASFPVGKVTTMQLYPMDFEEFLMAMGQQQLLKLMHLHDFQLFSVLLLPLHPGIKLGYLVNGC